MIMEERETARSRGGDTLVFAINGERFEISTVDPSTTLLEFLRNQTCFKGAKLSCGEGGCGACVVLLSKYDPVANQVESFTVSSCLTLLCSVDRCSITTTEGLGNSKDGFHPIHERMAGFHASQCGFCTPGMCISLFSAIVNAEMKPGVEPPKGFSKLTVSEAEKAISGNLCRCTGYRPIADACKSFASDVDMEDLGMNSFWKKGDTTEEKANELPYYNANNPVCTFPEFLKNEIKFSLVLKPKRYSWLNPISMKELQSMLDSNSGENDKRIKLVVGNTGTGYYKEVEQYNEYIDLRYIPELSMIRRDEVGIEIGATVTISKAIVALREKFKNEFQSPSEAIFRKLSDHMEKIASGFIRNSASIGGNLVMAQQNHFPSDIATILLSVNSTVNVMTKLKCEQISLEEFLERPPLGARSILLSVQIPSWKKARKSYKETNNQRLLFETYRASPRPLGNALAYLNAAFLAEITPHKDSDCVVLGKVRLCFGAYGTKQVIRARKVEEFLAGKHLSIAVLSEAIKLLRNSIVPDVGTSHADYKSSLAVGFLFEFLHQFINDRLVSSSGQLDGCRDTVNGEIETIDNHERNNENVVLSSGRQVVEINNEYYPVGKPITKAGAAIQASGEAVYVDDIPSPANCLHGAFIYSTKPFARVKRVEIKSKSSTDGAAEVISFKDIPNGGDNIGSKTIFGAEPLFSDDLTRFSGERIAFVVADTQKLADMAADGAFVDYDTNDLELPILTVEEAVEKKSFFEVPPSLCPSQVGDFSKGMAEADHKILSTEIKLGSQYFFYMETQTALAIPDEDNCMVVYSSIQCPEYLHSVIAKCLGVPEHNVRVITRRVGGGFGGKSIRAMPVATACALAANKLRRPVRTYVKRKTDMIMAGGRHPMKITYSVGFKSSGKITALHLDILINAGLWADISLILPSNMIGALKKYNWGAFSFDIRVCKTNHSTKTAMRAPGEPQATFIAESVIEHVASVLGIEVDSVRNKNFHNFESLKVFYMRYSGEAPEYTLPHIWDKLATTSRYRQRVETLKIFNQCNKWKKRGISRVPIVHEVILRPTPGKVSILSDGSVVVEVGGIEIGQGLWTKVKQMAAFGLSSIKCDGIESLLDKVRVIQADTLSMIQGGFTAGSTTSESSCEAVRLCCNVLLERLAPVKDKLQNTMGHVKWEALIQQAQMQSINLSAHSYYVPDSTSLKYLNYGAAVSEVEVDLLTGETRILQSDIIYDCGQSLNPAVDLGQIEGAFVQGIGFFMQEEYTSNSDGLVTTEGTWTYKIPTIDTIPQQFNVEILNSGLHQKRILSSKASGEPPLLLAVSVHCATRAAIIEARQQLNSWKGVDSSHSALFQLKVPATMPIVKKASGLDIIESYLSFLAKP